MTKLSQTSTSRMGVGVEMVEKFSSLGDDAPTTCFRKDSQGAETEDGERVVAKRSRSPACPGSMEAAAEEEEEDKRARLRPSTPAPGSPPTSRTSRESYLSRRKRFIRTAEVLRKSGLLDVTMKTAELLRKNQEIQREIENLQKETKSFVLSVLSNPENNHILDSIRSGAQLYELVVPGSQGIMSVSMQLRDINMNQMSPVSDHEENPFSSLASSHNRTSLISTDASSSGNSSDSFLSCDDTDMSGEENLAPPKPISCVLSKETKQP